MALLIAGGRRSNGILMGAALRISQCSTSLGRNNVRIKKTCDSLCYFGSSRNPPGKDDDTSNRDNLKNSKKERFIKNEADSNRATENNKGNDRQPKRFKSKRKKEWKKSSTVSEATGYSKITPTIQNSGFTYDSKRHHRTSIVDNGGNLQNTFDSPRLSLPVLNASALLDPLAYCKSSAKTAHTHGVNRSISGTDAARRLLRGKKELLIAARSLRTPAMIEGHGVPKQLFQHCIDMADAFLLQYGEDVVECTFHNYYPASKLPQVIRSRSQGGVNRCTPWPPPSPSLDNASMRSSKAIDWNYHWILYLTVLERISCHLGMIFQRRHTAPTTLSISSRDDADDFMASSMLFPQSPLSPHWNVDVLRGAAYDIRHANNDSGACNIDAKEDIPPFPIVEFNHDSDTTGHVLIRIQGKAKANDEFDGIKPSPDPVTLVFDACFHRRE